MGECFEELESIKEKGEKIYKYKFKANFLQVVVAFVCEEKNCSSFDDYVKTHTFDGFGFFGNISIEYPGFKINHFGNPPI